MLVDYFQSHVVTSKEYHVILKKKTMDKVAVNEAKKAKRKQKKDGRLKKTTNTPTLEEQIALREKVKGKLKPPLMHNGPL